MGLSIEEIIKAKEEYVKDYFEKNPYKSYINGVGISNLKVRVGKEEIKLKGGETLEDYCLNVFLIKALPEGLTLPLEYKGVRVFYKIIAGMKKH